MPKCMIRKANMQKKSKVNWGEKMFKAMTKIQKYKRFSSQEFLKIYDAIWQEGPKTFYKNPDNWRKAGDSL